MDRLLPAVPLLALLCVLPAHARESEVYTAVAGPDGVQRAVIIAGSYYFKPDYIIVKAGIPVELIVKKESSIKPHDFVLKALEAGVDVSVDLAEAPKKITFTPAQKGVYTFYCDKRLLFFKSHRDRGMEGRLVVE